MSIRPKTNKRGGTGVTGKGTITKMSDTGQAVVAHDQSLCVKGLDPNQKTKTGLIATNDGSVKLGQGQWVGQTRSLYCPSLTQ